MKRVLTITLALMLMFALCVPAVAADTGSITIKNAAIGETYKVFKMATLNSFSGSSYSYTVEPEWKEFFSTGAGDELFDVTAEGEYLIRTTAVLSTTKMEELAKKALEYAEAKNIPAVASETATSSSIVFDSLALGYYLVDTSLGTLCMIDTTNANAEVADKNSGPTVIKEVLEDGDGTNTAYADTNDADIYQPIQFRTQIDCKKGATKYVLHDKMTNMEFDATSLKIYNGTPLAGDTNLISAEGNYTLVTTDLTDGCAFHVVFSQAFCDTFNASTNIVLYYQASLTTDAVVAGAGNPNETHLTYGDAQESNYDSTTTYTYEFQMVKTDDQNAYLPGATFTLWTAAEGGNEIKFVKVDDNTYRIADEGDTPADVITLVDGKAVKITGLDGRTHYYLQEETAPEGYNKMVSRKDISIESSNLNLIDSVNVADAYVKAAGGIQVINHSGTLLPETGGIGTTMFIFIGTLLVLGAGILLATKMRMSKIAE